MAAMLLLHMQLQHNNDNDKVVYFYNEYWQYVGGTL